MYHQLSVFTGNTHPELAQAVCNYLEVPLGRAEVFEFSNENIFVKIVDHVREQDVFLIQPTCSPVHRSIMELLIMIDTLKRASAGRITAVLPYYGYGRTDKKDQARVPITARLIADLITVAGANRVLMVDLHAGQIEGFFNIPVDKLTALHVFSEYFMAKKLDRPVVVSADVGFSKRARNFAEVLNAPLAIVEKRRIGNLDRAEALNIIGDVANRDALVVDDEIDTAGSVCQAATELKRRGARDIYVCATHAVFSGPAIERLESSPIREIVVTDTVPVRPEKRLPKITVLSIAELIGESISRIHRGESIAAIYEEHGVKQYV